MTKRKQVQQPMTDDVPYTMRMPDGRTLFVLVPAKWCELDVTGELLFKPDAIRFLDRIRVLAMKMPKRPTPGFIRTLRDALGLTQVELGERIGVDSMTVSRWERGAVKPGPAAVKALDKLRRDAGRRGVTIAA
jgi:Helix-turn-helix domain